MPQQVPEDVKNDRVERLMLTQQQIAFQKGRERIGQELLCLIDTVDEKSVAKGRFYAQAPEIDSICCIESCKARPGRFIEVKVTAAKEYDLLCRPIL